ncbi:hypothetical protein AVEN_242665-1, partial [Araneus ventricosus]
MKWELSVGNRLPARYSGAGELAMGKRSCLATGSRRTCLCGNVSFRSTYSGSRSNFFVDVFRSLYR